jgi:hypothetical protein
MIGVLRSKSWVLTLTELEQRIRPYSDPTLGPTLLLRGHNRAKGIGRRDARARWDRKCVLPLTSHHTTLTLLSWYGDVVPTGRYDNLLRRQRADLAAFASDEAIDISTEIDYESVRGLSEEIKERLKKIRPASIVSSFPLFDLGRLVTRVLIATYTGCR